MALNERTETLLLGALGDEDAKNDMVDAINANNLPDQAGKAGKFLSTDGTEVSWQTAGGGGGTPGGSDTQVQFNDSGSFGGNSALTFDKATSKTTFNGILQVDPAFNSDHWGAAPGLINTGSDAANNALQIASVNKTGASGTAAIAISSGTVVDGQSGTIEIVTGGASGTGSVGQLNLFGGNAAGSGVGGDVFASAGSSDSGQAGIAYLYGGVTNTGTPGRVLIRGGYNNAISEYADVVINDAVILSNQGGITLPEISKPSSPSAGFNKLYFKSDHKLYRLQSDGTEVLIG